MDYFIHFYNGVKIPTLFSSYSTNGTLNEFKVSILCHLGLKLVPSGEVSGTEIN